MLATHDGCRLDLLEIHRFAGYAVERSDGPHWDVPALLAAVDEGLRRARDRCGRIDSIGVDSWGLDYALFGADGMRTGEPHHYRHARSERGHRLFPHEGADLFAVTGAQELSVNTIFQLHDEARHHPERHAGAVRLLMMADMVNQHLTGAFRSEITLARTSGLLGAGTDAWSCALCDKAGIPFRLLQPTIRAGERYGTLRPALAEPLGWGAVPVMAVAAHDTASAVTALDLGDSGGFLICGSWLLFGVEQAAVDTRDAVRRAGFGNEGGVEGRTFLVKSLDGLHLIRKLRDDWRRRAGENLSFEELAQRADAARTNGEAFAIDPADPLFFDPPDMVAVIHAYLVRHHAPVPENIGGLALAVYAGLAAKVAVAVRDLETLRGAKLPAITLCGGGAQDPLLRRLVAEAAGKPLRLGPVEASAWGNAIMQLRGLGVVKSLDEGRRLVDRSLETRDLPSDP